MAVNRLFSFKTLIKISVLVGVVVAAFSFVSVSQAADPLTCSQDGAVVTCTGGIVEDLYGPTCSSVIVFDNDNFTVTGTDGYSVFYFTYTGSSLPNVIDSYITCAADAAPAIWLADVCENPFDQYGQMTLDTDVDGQLQVSADGSTWTALEAAGPPYVLTEAQVQGLTAALGAANWWDLQFRIDNDGKPNSLANMLADRADYIENACNATPFVPDSVTASYSVGVTGQPVNATAAYSTPSTGIFSSLSTFMDKLSSALNVQ